LGRNISSQTPSKFFSLFYFLTLQSTNQFTQKDDEPIKIC